MNLSDIAGAHEIWFRKEATHLEPDVGVVVLDALNAPNRRHVWLALNNLSEKFALPAEWLEQIRDYYDCVF